MWARSPRDKTDREELIQLLRVGAILKPYCVDCDEASGHGDDEQTKILEHWTRRRRFCAVKRTKNEQSNW